MSIAAINPPVPAATLARPSTSSQPGTPLDLAQSSSSATTARLHLPGVKMLAGSTLASLLSQQVVGTAVSSSNDANAPDDAGENDSDGIGVESSDDQSGSDVDADADADADADEVQGTPDTQETVTPQNVPNEINNEPPLPAGGHSVLPDLGQ